MKETNSGITNWKLIEKKNGEVATCKFRPNSEYVRIEYLKIVFSCSPDKTSLRLDLRYRPSKNSTPHCSLTIK